MNIFLGIVGGIAAVAAIVFAFVFHGSSDFEGQKYPKFMHLILILGVIMFIAAFSFSIIPTGYTGVRVTFGQIDLRPVHSGFNLRIPFVQSIETINNKLQDVKIEGQIWSETSARTALFYDGIVISYQIQPEQSAWILSNVSNYRENLISASLVASAVKKSSVLFADIEATNRGKIEPAVMQNLQSALDEKYGTNIIRIARVVISNVDFEESYQKAIADKQAAQLAYEQQQILNKQAVEKADADAKVRLTTAKATADAAVLAAQGTADANKLIADSLSDDIFMQRFYEKWNGQLPYIIGSDSGTILDMSNLIPQTTAQTGK